MESQNFLHDMQKRIRLRFLLVFAVWFGAVCGITAIISLFQGFQRDEALAVFSAAMLIGFFVLVGMLGITGSRFEKELDSMPELHPADGNDAAYAEQDAAYQAQVKKISQDSRTMIIIGILLPPLLLPLFILSEFNYRVQIKKRGLHAGTAACELSVYTRRLESNWGWIGFFLLLFSFCLLMFSAMYSFTAKGRLTALNSTAKYVYTAAVAYQNDLDLSDKPYQLETTIVNIAENRTNNPLHQGIYPYFNDSEKINYAVICDETGKVTGALASRRPITEEDLAHPQSFEEQYAICNAWFRTDQPVGNYLSKSN
ncbi:MAG: hypothetical protein J6S92_11605 [Oscillospiraceae bacterium]|nr:hypothetical protein [Oscillospiraceae bacterium]